MSLRDELEAIAAAEGLIINPWQEHKIQMMEEAGRCYCSKDRTCPCEERKDDLEEWGCCLCRVLVTEKYLKNYERGRKARDKKSGVREDLVAPREEPAQDGEPAEDGQARPVEDTTV